MRDEPNDTLWPLDLNLPTKLQTLINSGTDLKPINIFMATGKITKTGTLATTFHRSTGEANPYVRFGYGPMTIFDHTRGNFSWSMETYPINMIHTSQQSTKKRLERRTWKQF